MENSDTPTPLTDQYNETLIEIIGSNFTKCIAEQGPILYVNHNINQKAMQIKLRDSIFSDNFARANGVFHIHSYN